MVGLSCGRDRPVDSLRRLRVFALGFAAVLAAWAMTASAQTGPTYSATVHGFRVQPVGQATATINMRRGPDGVWTQANYALNAATLGRFGKAALRGLSGAAGAYALVKGVVDAAGWVINELQQQVETKGDEATPIANGTPVYCIAASVIGKTGSMRCTETVDAMVAFAMGQPFNGNAACPFNDHYYTPAPYAFSLGSACGWTSVTRYNFDSNTMQPAGGNPPRVVTDEELGQRIAQATNGAAQAVMTNPQGQPYDHQELRDAINAALANWASQNGDTYTPPVYPPVQDPNGSTGPNPAPGTDPTAPPTNINLEFPVFCEWASVVCDFINWYKEEPEMTEPEVPEEEFTPPEESWSSGLPSTGSCPAPVTLAVGIGPVSSNLEFSYEPLCGLGTYMRPVFIAGALVIAAFIVGGFRSGKHA